MNKVFSLFIIFTLVGCSSTLDNKPEALVQCIITKAGLTDMPMIGTLFDPNSPTGLVNVHKELIVYEETTQIPLRENISFGFTYTFLNLPKRALIDEKVTHPKFIKPSGKVTYGYYRKKQPSSGSGYKLDTDFEQVPGKWTFEYSYKGKKLCEQSFNVYRI